MKKLLLLFASLSILSCGNNSKSSSESEEYSTEEYQINTSNEYYDENSYNTQETVTSTEDRSSTSVETSHTNTDGYSATMRDNGNGSMDYHDNTGYSVSSIDNGSSITVSDNEGNTYTIDY